MLDRDVLLEIAWTKARGFFGSSVIFFVKYSIDASVNFFSHFYYYRYNH